MKWFSISGIREEMKKTRWPNKKEMASDSATVLVFMGLFALFFEVSSAVILMFLRMIGVVA